MNLLGKVRRLHYRDGLNLSEIERRTGLTRKTLRKWLKAPEGVEPKYRRKRGETKLAPYAEGLVRMLEADARRPVRDRRTALKLFAELKSLGFDGDYSRVTEFIRNWRGGCGAALAKAFVPLQFEPGEALEPTPVGTITGYASPLERPPLSFTPTLTMLIDFSGHDPEDGIFLVQGRQVVE